MKIRIFTSSVRKFSEFCKDDLDPNQDTLQWNWKCGLHEKCKMAESQTLPLTLTDVLLFADKVSFPNIHTAYQTFATVPVFFTTFNHKICFE